MVGRHDPLGLISESQKRSVKPGLRATSGERPVEVVVISSRLGYRKPERRMFQNDLDLMGLRSDEVVHVGELWDRDTVGAREVDTGGGTGLPFDDRDRCQWAGELAVAVIHDP